MGRTRKKRIKDPKYKSGLESRCAKLLPNPELYESVKIKFQQDHVYTPDFPISDTKFIEVKGYFRAHDRQKHIDVKKQHPEYEVFFVFGNSENKLSKNSKTSYADWCKKHGFKFCDIKDGIPKEWFTNEKKGKEQ